MKIEGAFERLFLYLSIMFRILFFFLILQIASCNSSLKNEKQFDDNSSRILNVDLKNQLPKLINTYEKYFFEQNQKGEIIFNFTISENYIYVHLSKMNCPVHLESYGFLERIEEKNHWIFINEPFVKLDRYFDLKSLQKTPKNFEAIICDDFYFILARYRIIQEQLIHEKTFFSKELENVHEIYSIEDLENENFINTIIIVEPEPTLPNENMK